MQFDRLIRGKDKIRSWSWMKKILAIKFYSLNCDELLSYTKQDYNYWQRSSHLNYFEEPYIPPLKEELHVEENMVFDENYVEVKEENIKISEETNEDLVIEENPKIKIILEENNENLIIEKDLEVEMVETIEDEIEEESFKDLNESNHIIVNLKILLFWW